MQTRTKMAALLVRSFSVAVVLCLFIFFAGFVSPRLYGQANAGGGNATLSAPAGEAGIGSSLPIATGDLVEITVFGAPELSSRYRVSQDGDIDLILGGRLHVAGLTADAAAVHVEDILREKQILLIPHVNVIVREYSSQGVTILGEVKSPGVYPSLGEHRLYDLLAAAGGFTGAASNKITIIHQADPSHPQVLELSNMAMTDGASDVPVLTGDRVIVGSGGIVYVIGDVARPGGFVLGRSDSRLTVLKVLSMSQGPSNTAKLGSAMIITQTPDGLTHRNINLKDIMRNKVPDPLLAAGDVLYVPTSLAKFLGYRSIEAAFSAASSASVIVAER